MTSHASQDRAAASAHIEAAGGRAMTPHPGTEPYEAEVRGYVADCLRLRGQLDPAYHPTADGAVKMIPHGGSTEEAERIRQTFAAVTSLTEPEAGQ